MIELAKRGRGVSWSLSGTNKPPEDLKSKTFDKIFEIVQRYTLGKRQRIRWIRLSLIAPTESVDLATNIRTATNNMGSKRQ